MLLRGLLTDAVGVDEHVEPIWPSCTSNLRTFTLCSDGLTDVVPDVDIAEVTDPGVNPPLTAEHLIDLAKTIGAAWIMSVVVISSCSAALGTELG